MSGSRSGSHYLCFICEDLWQFKYVMTISPAAICRLIRASISLVTTGLSASAAFLDLSDLTTPMALDDLLEAMRIAGPSKADISRDGDVIHWTEQHQGQCVCPFIRRGVVRLDPKLCICGAYWVKYLFEKVARTAVEVETIETVATGAENCRFRIAVKSELPASPKGRAP